MKMNAGNWEEKVNVFPTNKDFWVITAAMTMNVWKQEGRTHIFRPVKMILRNAKDYMSDLSMMLKFYLWMVIWAEQAFVGQWTQVNVSSLQINSKLHSERCLFIPPDFTIKALIGGRHSAWKLVRAREEQESRDKEHVVQRDTLGTVHCWAAVPCTAAAAAVVEQQFPVQQQQQLLSVQQFPVQQQLA